MEKNMEKAGNLTPEPNHLPRERELIELRDEPNSLLDGFFEQYGSCIVRGCEVIGNRITPGIVALAGIDNSRRVFRLLRFPGADHVEQFPAYLTLHKNTLKTDTEATRPIAFRYEIRVHTTHPGLPCLVIDADGENREFIEAVQDDRHRFVTEDQQTEWNRISDETLDKKALEKSFREAIPTGTVLTFAGERFPAGWIPCDGRHLDKQEYSELYEAIGDRFGADTTRFRIPDLRAGFIRGLDHSVHAALTYAIRARSDKDTESSAKIPPFPDF